MADHEEILMPLRLAVKEKGDIVRQLKADKADQMTIKAAVQELKKCKDALTAKELDLAPKTNFDRELFENSCKRRFFYGPAFELYGGISGLYDFGPVGCMLKNNILSTWREFFVQEEDMLEIEATMLTPKPVLTASGHVDKFEDLMVTDVKTGEFFRADHLLENHLEKFMKTDDYLKLEEEKRQLVKYQLNAADTFDIPELTKIFNDYGIKSPTTGNELNPPVKFNLMFKADIGPGGNIPAYLRPETAQGIFVNYPRLSAFNNGKLPFACAQIGHAFRNEISPRAGLLRVREFQMAEIEHFLDPADKSHPKFKSVENIVIPVWPKLEQTTGKSVKKISIGEAVKNGVIDNESLGYFIGRIWLYAVAIGLDEERIRFRQHMENEMAHYACDCWDLEGQTSYGWIELLGCADRSAYDLNQHAKATNTKIIAKRKLKEPKEVTTVSMVANKKVMGKDFKKQAGEIQNYLAGLEASELETMFEKLQVEDVDLKISSGEFKLRKDHITKLDKVTKKVHEEDYVPSVIEPSFGIGRIFYCLLEQSFGLREQSEEDKSSRVFFKIKPVIAPYKCSVLRLLGKPEYDPLMKQISALLKNAGLSHKVDDVRGISIGKRYARTDEIAVPFGITVDGESVEESQEKGDNNWSVTVRERDSMLQIRVPINKLSDLLVSLCTGEKKWQDIYDKEFKAYLPK